MRLGNSWPNFSRSIARGSPSSERTDVPAVSARPELWERLLEGLPVRDERLQIGGISTAVLVGGEGLPLALYGFTWGWNDRLFSLTLVTSESMRKIGPGLLFTCLGEFQ